MKNSEYWSRVTKCRETEVIQGSQFLEWSFTTRLGKVLLRFVFSTRLFSRIFYGWTSDARWSVKSIQPFIEKFKISMDDYEETSYSTFNEFFIRRFKPGVRSFISDLNEFPALAEGRYFGYSSTHLDQSFPVKGTVLTLSGILASHEKAHLFKGGPLLICRLGPADYHRIHFPDKGHFVEQYRIPGPLYSTNPICYQYKPDVLMTNERYVSLIETESFGLLAVIEVGAMCVGRIVQSHSSSTFARGDEKGFFLVGGSTVIVLGQSGRWKPSQDILSFTDQGMETHVLLGDSVGKAC